VPSVCFRLRSFLRANLLFLATLLLLPACSVTTEISGPTSANTPTSGADQELSSEQVFESIESSVVFLLAPDGESSGSGIVIDGGWILTNAHVVDRHESMTVGRSDGQDIGLHPVHAVDWVFDLALIGPLDDPLLTPIALGSSSDLGIGARVLLAGFPDEDSTGPTPTLTEGIVSRRRSIAVGEYPFLQVDATIAPGQSGGALVNGEGELVGISGLEFGEGEFGLVFESDLLGPRIDRMIQDDQPHVPGGAGVTELTATVGPLVNYSFTAQVDDDGGLDILVSGETDLFVDVQTLGGNTVSQVVESDDPFRRGGTSGELFIDELEAGGEEIIASLDPGTYQVVVGTYESDLDNITISSKNLLREFDDPEEATELPRDQVVEGDFNWVRDSDKWELTLEAGEEVVITADGISDTVLVVRLDDELIASSDDEGLGVFGTGAQVTLAADQAATYTVEVGTYDQTRWGYLIEATAVTE